MTKGYKNKLGIIGKKLGMTQYFDKEGDAIPVTVIEIAENIICDIKTQEKKGYTALQLGSNIKKEKHLTKPLLGNLKKKKLPNLSYLKEFRIKPDELKDFKIGDAIDTTKTLTPNERVDIAGISIGKGFQGMVKLYHKSRGFRSHGSKSIRAPGSIGAHTFPGRVLPGKRMPSMMGNEMVTVKNLKVVEFNKEKNIVFIKGAVPGTEGSLLTIRPASKL